MVSSRSATTTMTLCYGRYHERSALSPRASRNNPRGRTECTCSPVTDSTASLAQRTAGTGAACRCNMIHQNVSSAVLGPTR